MKTQLVILVLIASTISCNQNKAGKSIANSLDQSEVAKQNLSLENIGFDFSARRDRKNKGYINIDAVLSNSNVDTVYLFTWSDHGKQLSLLYDTTRFEYFPESIANGSFPLVEKIPPKKKLNFAANFKVRKEETKIKLEYVFCRIETPVDTDFRKMDFNKVVDFWKHRQTTIIHSKEKIIE